MDIYDGGCAYYGATVDAAETATNAELIAAVEGVSIDNVTARARNLGKLAYSNLNG